MGNSFGYANQGPENTPLNHGAYAIKHAVNEASFGYPGPFEAIDASLGGVFGSNVGSDYQHPLNSNIQDFPVGESFAVGNSQVPYNILPTGQTTTLNYGNSVMDVNNTNSDYPDFSEYSTGQGYGNYISQANGYCTAYGPNSYAPIPANGVDSLPVEQPSSTSRITTPAVENGTTALSTPYVGDNTNPPNLQNTFFPTPALSEHVCSTCNQTFSRHSDLQRHAKKHNPSAKIFDCLHQGCKYKGQHGFYREDKLLSHMRTRHTG